MENFSHLNLNFNAGTMSFEAQPPEWQRKGALIQDINTIQLALGKESVDEFLFEVLMQRNIEELQNMVNDQASLLARTNRRSQPLDYE